MKLDRSKLLKDLKKAFPEIKPFINAEEGLLDFEVRVFYLFTQKLINSGETDKVRICFNIADNYYRNGNSKVQHAIGVSYVECLEFKNTKKNIREWAWDMFPSALKEEYVSFHGKPGI